MARKNRRSLEERVVEAAEAWLSEQGTVSPIEVLLGIGWLDPDTMKRWRQGRIDYLERVLQPSPSRVAEAIKIFRSWATGKELIASETDYVARTPERQALRFTESGMPTIERAYRTHWVSPKLDEKKRAHLTEAAGRAPELVVVDALNREWTCHKCGGTGGFLMMENAGPACLRCTGLDDLEFLPSGDALLTRRAKAKSTRHAVVIRFSKARRRYERQGLLVEQQALEEAEREVEAKRGK